MKRSIENKNRYIMVASKKFSTTLFLFLMGICAVALSQPYSGETLKSGTKNENVYVSLSSQIFVTGEELRYCARVLDASSFRLSNDSKILYFELTDYTGRPVLTWQNRIENGMAYSSYRLPDTLNTGCYRLKAYTNWMRNDQYSSGFTIPLVIYKISDTGIRYLPKLLKETEIQTIGVHKPEELSQSLTEHVNIQVEGKSYGKREKVPFTVTLQGMTPGDTAYVSVSIGLSPPTGIIQATSQAWPGDQPETTETAGKFCKHLLENRGFILSGKLLHLTTMQPISNGLVVMQAVDSIPMLQYCYTDVNGCFGFLVEKKDEQKELVLQLLSNLIAPNDLLWQPDPKNDVTITPSPIDSVALKPACESFLEKMKDIQLVNAIYHKKKDMDTSFVCKPSTVRPFFYSSDHTIYPSDYEDLENFSEIALNILPEVRFREKNKKYFVQVLDVESRVMMEPGQWVILNGVLFNDLDYIQTLNTSSIRSINVVSHRLMYGDMTFNGLVSIQTYDGKVPETTLQSKAFLYRCAVIHNSNKEESIDAASNLPDFRKNLLWKPDVRITANGHVPFELITSDLSGTYMIEVTGFTKSGKPLSAYFPIDIR
jgi:hypothetical protein